MCFKKMIKNYIDEYNLLYNFYSHIGLHFVLFHPNCYPVLTVQLALLKI